MFDSKNPYIAVISSTTAVVHESVITLIIGNQLGPKVSDTSELYMPDV